MRLSGFQPPSKSGRSLRLGDIAVPVGVWLVAFAACSVATDRSPESRDCVHPSDAPPALRIDGLSLRAEISQTGTSLTVRYELRNASSSEIAVLNHIPSPTPQQEPDLSPNDVYIAVENDEVHLRKTVLRIPDGLEMAELPLPWVSRVLPGETFAETFAIPVPVRANDPIQFATLAATNPHARIVPHRRLRTHTVVFQLGVVPVGSNVRLIPVSVEGQEIYRLWPPGPALDNLVLLCRRLTLEAEVTAFDYVAESRGSR